MCIKYILSQKILVLNIGQNEKKYVLNLYLMETPINPFANRIDPDQAALVRAACSGSTLFAYGNVIYLILH